MSTDHKKRREILGKLEKKMRRSEWKVDPANQTQICCGYSTIAETALTYGLEVAIDNAKLIVRAVNSHDAMVEALEFVLSQIHDEADPHRQAKLYSDCLHPTDDDKTVKDIIREALAKAGRLR